MTQAGEVTWNDVPCPGCGCVCDDVSLTYRGDELVEFRPHCSLGERWFRVHGQPAGAVAEIQGRPAEFMEAIEHAAALLKQSDYSLIYGLSRSATPGQRAAVALAEQLGAAIDTTASLCHGPSIMALQEVVRKVPVAEHVFVYARDLVRATRPQEPDAQPFIREYVSWGAGPRAGQYLIIGAKARAILEGRFHVSTEDVRAVAHPVLRHRLVTTFQADSEKVTSDAVVDMLLQRVPVELKQRARKIAPG